MKLMIPKKIPWGIVFLCCGLLWQNGPKVYAAPQQKQSFTLQGIINGNGQPLPGVIVTIKDNNENILGVNATLTDAKGSFELPVQTGNVLTFSFVGYSTQHYTVGTAKTMSLTMTEESTTLTDITINAGYYEVENRKNTGSIARITAKDIEYQAVHNPLQALQGRLAGVNITQGTGVVGGGFNVEIRGRNTLGNSKGNMNKPLYILDGMPLPELDFKEVSDLSSKIFDFQTNSLNGLNPADIESIEILKDADATAIYGSRGANGVILISTKKGIPGKTKFTVSSTTGFSKVPHFIDLVDTQQYLQIREEAFANAGATANFLWPRAYDVNGTWDKTRYTDWQKVLIGGTALDQSIQLGVSGGNALTRFNANLAHHENGTVFPDSRGSIRNTLALNFSHQSANNKFKWNATTHYSVATNQLPAADLTSSAFTLPPNAPALYAADGSLNWENGTWQNPMAPLVVTYLDQNRQLGLTLHMAYEIAPKLHFKINAGINSLRRNEQKLEPHTQYNPSLGRTPLQSISHQGHNFSDSYNIEPQLDYTHQWGLHEISALVGGTFHSDSRDGLQIQGNGFTSNIFIENIGLANSKKIVSLYNSQYKYGGVYGRFNYTYKNAYVLNLTGRRDGSSRFGPDNRYGNFGAIGAAWIFSEEPWTKKLPWLSYGKLRSSYGITGSDNIGDYEYLDTYTAGSYPYDGLTPLGPSRLLNANYGWTENKKIEMALDWGLWNNRFNGTLAWYQNRSSDQLVKAPMPATTGFPSMVRNWGAVIQNRGWELSLSSHNIQTPKWSWSSAFNISFPSSKLVAYPGIETSPVDQYSYTVGKSNNLARVYRYEGLDPLTGYYKITDFNEDGFLSFEDQRPDIELNPKFLGGLQNTLRYKNWSLDFLLQFVKQDNFNYDRLFSSTIFGSTITSIPTAMLDYWTPENPDAHYALPLATQTDFMSQMSLGLLGSSSRAVSDASYVRLKNAMLSYNLPFKRAKIENIRLYVTGQNLYTWTNHYFGLDPEFTTFGMLPPLRSFSFGMQLTF